MLPNDVFGFDLENSLTLEDLQSLAPEVARGLKQLLDYSDRNEREVFGLTFEITVPDVDGKMVTYPLKVGNRCLTHQFLLLFFFFGLFSFKI